MFLASVALLFCTMLLSCSKSGQNPNPSGPTGTTGTTGNTGPTTPTIVSIQPNSGFADDVVTITGANYSTVLAEDFVKFNGTAATIVSATATQLTVKVPQNGTSGQISVKVKNSDYVTGNVTFTYLPTATISGFTPSEALPGATVTITGTNFSTVTTDNTVLFNATPATVKTATATQLTVVVPQGATSGPIKVTINKHTVASQPFKVIGLPASLTWEELNTPAAVGDIVMSASADSVVVFANSVPVNDPIIPHLFRIKNGVVTDIYSSLGISFGGASSLTNGTNAFYMLSAGHVYRSEDGLTWKSLYIPQNVPTFILGVTTKDNEIVAHDYNTAYVSTDKGSTWNTQSSVNPGSNQYAAGSSIYLNQAAGGYYYSIPFTLPIDLPITRSTDGINWTTARGQVGNTFDASNGYYDVLAASGNNVFSVFYPGDDRAQPSQKRLFKSIDHGDTWTQVNDDQVNSVKTTGGYLMYGYDNINISLDDGNTFTKYAIPAGNIIGGIQYCDDGYLYIFCANGGAHKVLRAKLQSK